MKNGMVKALVPTHTTIQVSGPWNTFASHPSYYLAIRLGRCGVFGCCLAALAACTFMFYKLRLNTQKQGFKLVGGLEHEFYDFPYIGKNNPN
jgi:hypothetical protein